MERALEGEDDGTRVCMGRPTTRWFEVALIFAVFFVDGGAPSPQVNEAHYLCKAKHYWQADWCAGDMFLESSDAHLALYWAIGWLTRWFSMPVVAWIGRVVAWGLLAWAWQRLVRTVVHRPFYSVLGAMLFVTLIRQAHFAGEWIVGGVESKCFAYVFVLLGLEAIATGGWRRCWPLFGLASTLHPVVGGWAVVAAAVVWLTEPAAQRPKLAALLPALMLGGVLALPGLLPVLGLARGVPPEVVDQSRQIYVFDRLPHHLAPLTKPGWWIAERATRHGLLVLGLWLVVGYLRTSGDLRPSGDASPVGSSSPNNLNNSQSRQTSLSRIVRFAWAALGLSVGGLVAEVVLWNHPSLAARVLRFYWFRLADIAVPLAASLAVLFAIARLVRSKPKWAAAALLATVCLPSWHLLSTSVERYFNRCPPGDYAIRNFVDWRAACHWARENTPADSVFLVPKNGQTFKWYAHRSDVVTWKDIPQDAAGIVAWRDRYADVYFNNWDTDRVPYLSLAAQGTKRIGDLAERYGADFVLTRSFPPLQLPVVYANEKFTVYKTKR